MRFAALVPFSAQAREVFLRVVQRGVELAAFLGDDELKLLDGALSDDDGVIRMRDLALQPVE